MSPPKSRRWTPAEQQALRRLAIRGTPAREIARLLDRTLAAIRIKAAHGRIAIIDTHTSGPRRFWRPAGDE